jgi:hypothetical protein
MLCLVSLTREINEILALSNVPKLSRTSVTRPAGGDSSGVPSPPPTSDPGRPEYETDYLRFADHSSRTSSFVSLPMSSACGPVDLLAYGNGRASSIPSPLYFQPFSRVVKGFTEPSLRRMAGDAQMLPDPPPRSPHAGRVTYNTLRPHSALGYRPPAPPNSISQPAAVI